MGNCWFGRKKKRIWQKDGNRSSTTFGSKSLYPPAFGLSRDADPVVQEQMYVRWSEDFSRSVLLRENNNPLHVREEETVQIPVAEVVDYELQNEDEVNSSIYSTDVARSQTRTPTLNSFIFDHRFKTPASRHSDFSVTKIGVPFAIAHTPQNSDPVSRHPSISEDEAEAENSMASLDGDMRLRKIRPMPTPLRDITNFTPNRDLETLFNNAGRPKRSESALKYCQEKRQRHYTCNS